MCENVDWKIEHLRQAFPTCRRLFNNMQDLKKAKAFDAVSGHVVPVPGVAGFILMLIIIMCS